MEYHTSKIASHSPNAILNAGYYHIRSEEMIPVQKEFRLEYQTDTAYLIPAQNASTEKWAGLAYLPRLVDANDLQYILYRPKCDAEPIILNHEEVPMGVKKLSFAPAKTEKATLEYGLNHFKNNIANVAIVADELGLPTGLSQHLNMVLPESYQKLLADSGYDSPLIISERLSRNKASQLSKPSMRKSDKEDSCNGDNASPFAVINVSGQYALKSPFVIGQTCSRVGCGGLVGAVGLTKPNADHSKQVPSCGTLIAGNLMEIAKASPSQIISIYNLADDTDIVRKLFDGAVIAAWLKPELELQITNIAVNGGIRRPATEYQRQDWHFSQLRGQEAGMQRA